MFGPHILGCFPVIRLIISISTLLSARFWGSSTWVRNCVTEALVSFVFVSATDASLSVRNLIGRPQVAIPSLPGNTSAIDDGWEEPAITLPHMECANAVYV